MVVTEYNRTYLDAAPHNPADPPPSHCDREAARPSSQTLRQTARGCSAMRAVGCCIFFSSSDPLSMPLFFASNALMPYDKMPEWLRLLAMVNPLSHTIDSIRVLFAGQTMDYVNNMNWLA